MKLSGLTLVRNGFECGYTFIETIKTLEAICDEVIVCEGYSTDNTFEAIKQHKSDKTIIYQDEWQKSSCGLEFARITNLGMSRCSGDYIMLLQADEIIHESNLPKIRQIVDTNQFNSIQFGFIHLRYDLANKINDPGVYDQAIRIIRNKIGIGCDYDGWNFAGPVQPSTMTHITVYHAGYVFLYNILQKMINHAKEYYVTESNYQERAKIASGILDNLKLGHHVAIEDVHQSLEPYYRLVPHGLPIPALLQRHIGKLKYEL